MPHVAAARTVTGDLDAGRYHRPEQTLLYQIVGEYYPAFAALLLLGLGEKSICSSYASPLSRYRHATVVKASTSFPILLCSTYVLAAALHVAANKPEREVFPCLSHCFSVLPSVWR